MSSIFSSIVKGAIPCHKVAENEEFLAFMDAMPLRAGHVLVIPKVEIDYIFDIEDELLDEIQKKGEELAKNLDMGGSCESTY